MVLVRYYQQHAALLPSAEMARIALAYWSDFFAGATVAEVTTQRQREFVEWLRERGPKSDGYIKRILTVGKSALIRAYKEGEIESAPFVLPGSDSPARDLTLSPDQSRALWAAAERQHERLYLALAYGTLARPEAILGLEWSFVDMERRLIDQNPPGRAQTKKYRPVVPVCDWLAPWLAEGGNGPIVAWRGKPIASFKTAWRALRRRADLPEACVPKTIRHTMATALRAADVSEAEIQGMLGHKAYSGKTEVYAKFRPNFLGKASVAISEYMDALHKDAA